LHLVAVEIEIELGRIGGIGREHGPAERDPGWRENESARAGGEIDRAAPLKILKLVFEPAPGANPMMGGRLKAMTLASPMA
jgi:hypothetical protein